MTAHHRLNDDFCTHPLPPIFASSSGPPPRLHPLQRWRVEARAAVETAEPSDAVLTGLLEQLEGLPLRLQVTFSPPASVLLSAPDVSRRAELFYPARLRPRLGDLCGCLVCEGRRVAFIALSLSFVQAGIPVKFVHYVAGAFFTAVPAIEKALAHFVSPAAGSGV